MLAAPQPEGADQMSKPTFIACSVTDYTAGTEKKSKWREVGAAFAHKDGEGFDIVLEAFPVSGKVTLRKPKEKDEGHADEGAGVN
jgi:hypothetical protein